ncbi:TRAP transporter small permease subunit [Pusillimonas sp. SM2304]|uniref:TRAP transporter small permease subunit n=1 Tax=Pusillimonas sp. SM2304 TaxID=3073241 RepID=UPI0028761519|nr:TRAP transporter small permease subunit [Pusillimonas sp. SM2304]MDS1142236.1 TRAP transporter small permease subunit [Pusillimonas sp. SM2304]
MLVRLFRIVDGISWVASRLADVSVVVLIVAMVYEVAARYLFDAPTDWAFDIAYMCSGALFLLGVSWALKEDAHIRIDILRNRMSPRVAGVVEGITYLMVLAPFFAVLSYIAIGRTFKAWQTGEVEMVSPWAPLMWPFYLTIAIGLTALTLQLAVEGLRAFLGQRSPSKEVHA